MHFYHFKKGLLRLLQEPATRAVPCALAEVALYLFTVMYLRHVQSNSLALSVGRSRKRKVTLYLTAWHFADALMACTICFTLAHTLSGLDAVVFMVANKVVICNMALLIQVWIRDIFERTGSTRDLETPLTQDLSSTIKFNDTWLWGISHFIVAVLCFFSMYGVGIEVEKVAPFAESSLVIWLASQLFGWIAAHASLLAGFCVRPRYWWRTLKKHVPTFLPVA